jgi:transcriptional regulator GlxA family with amidase domain
MLLQSEFETSGGGGKHPDALLLTQSMELLVRHLGVLAFERVAQEQKTSGIAGRTTSFGAATPQSGFRYIDANIGSDIALCDLAQLVDVSKHYFIRSFRAATQRTPYAYLVDRRLVRAVDALRLSPMSIERIAREAGFKSARGFSNVFKKHYGMSPSKFRARSR